MGLSFLRDVKLGKKVEVGQQVLVLGGGNVAFDCARMALRLGAQQVHMACLESHETMPADPVEIKEGEEEGIIIHLSHTLTRIIGANGRVSAVECLDVLRMKFDEEGHLELESIPGSEHLISADTVIFAIGQAPDIRVFSKVEGLMTTGRNTIAVDPDTLSTEVPGIFAGGDAATLVGDVVESMAQGRKAAISIDRYLMGQDLKEGREAEKPPVTGKDTLPEGIRPEMRQGMPTLSVEVRIRTLDEIESGFTEEQAIREAQRCLSCRTCGKCMEFGCVSKIWKENVALSKYSPETDLDMCAGCNVCMQPEVCPYHSIEELGAV